MSKKLCGIRPWKGGWQAYVRVNGKLRSKSFPSDTALEKMDAWRASQQHDAAPRHTGPSFKRDVVAYLKRVRAMPTYPERRAHLIIWLNELGWHRPRSAITTAEIDHVMQAWLTAGLAADTVRKRRTSLLSMYHKLDGKAAANPVRQSTPPRASPALVRGLDTATLRRVLASLPPSRTAARLRVMAWTGLPPGLLMTITRAHIDLKRAELRVTARKKGAGSPARTLPLTPQGVAAFKELIRCHAFGKFARAAAGRVLHRACRRVNVAPIRLYDLRHSFGALLYRTTRDLPTVARFLLHSSLASTARYAMAAVGDVDREAARAVGQLSGQLSPPKRGLSRTVRDSSSSHRKRRRNGVTGRNASKIGAN